MLASSRRSLLKLSFVVAMVVFALSVPAKQASATCTYGGHPLNCQVQGCYDEIYCEAIACFQESWANGGDGSECCYYNTLARWCGSGCPRFCATP